MNYSIIVKRIGLFVFLLMPAIAFGQAGSGQLGPLHLPFEFKIMVNGLFHACSEAPQQPDSSFGSFEIDWTINPGDTNLHLSNDTITYSKKFGNIENGESDTSFTMIFDTTDKTIQDLSLNESYDVNYGGTFGFTDYSSSVELINLEYDSTSIFSPDSGLTNHLGGAGYYSSWLAATGNGPTYCDDLGYVLSLNLSGNFQPAVLWAGVAMPTASQSVMSIFEYDGIVQCEFPSSDHPRNLELYTPLGVMAASIEIPAGQSEISLPHLTSGFYFVRMDGDMIKIAVD